MTTTESNQRESRHEACIDANLNNKRLDQALAILFPDYSRSRLQTWIREKRVTLNGAVCRQRDKVSQGDQITLRAVLDNQVNCEPQNLPLDIVFEDEHLLIINKPANQVVHPAAGNPDNTVQNALLYHRPQLVELPRAGIVHRLDKDTTGLMVIAKTPFSHQKLVAALAARQISREYRALVLGKLHVGDTINKPIGRHSTQRTRMAVNPLGKPAITHYRILEQFHSHTLLKVRLETGRTHQIRVHMAYIRHPILGDPTYGGRLQLPAGANDDLKGCMRQFKRQALHAKRLGFTHPVTGRQMHWESRMPDDMTALASKLRSHAQKTVEY